MTPLSEKEQIEGIKSYVLKKYHVKSFGNLTVQHVKSGISPAVVSQDHISSDTEVANLGAVGNRPCPVSFDNGGYIFWQDGGATTDVNFSISGGIYSVGVSIGYRAAGVTQYAMYCLPGVNTLMGLEKTVKVDRYHLSGWDEVSNTYIDDYVNLQQVLNWRFYNCLA